MTGRTGMMGNDTRAFAGAITALVLALGAAPARADGEADPWAGYLDFAYVYSSADSAALRARLAEYGREAGMTLEDYLAQRLEAPATAAEVPDEVIVRRRAVAYLLRYLADGEPIHLETSVKAIRALEDNLERHENRYWYRYILAHQALERGHAADFVGELQELWLEVVVPLETAYETLHTLSLSESPNSGFVAALPYLFENVARLVLIRAPETGLDHGVDPLAALVRLLHDGRVGTHPDVIPVAASSRDYLERIVRRLDGPESDAGSLTFTLALFEASKRHDEARGLLAQRGFDDETVKAIRVASGAYETALQRADTVQGKCAVYTRVLRQLGEVYAARQRLGEDPDIETPFSIEGAIRVYEDLFAAREERWEELGYASTGRPSYVTAMHGLWSEIQETILNAADYYLTRASEQPHRADEHARNAARLYAHYLAFFHEFATAEGKEAVPDSAYFAAYEAGRGFGDAYLAYGWGAPNRAEVELAIRRYLAALRVFPFDRRLWSDLTHALERQGRENEYLQLVRPVAEATARSRAVNTWIENSEEGAEDIAQLRRALSDDQVLMYLGFAEDSGIEELEASVLQLRRDKGELERELETLTRRRDELSVGGAPAAPDTGAVTAAAGRRTERLELAEVLRRIEEKRVVLQRVERQIAARSRALPVYRETLGVTGFADPLRAQRDHPIHVLLRRLYHESRS